jgi:large subunit ribosomal protein L6
MSRIGNRKLIINDKVVFTLSENYVTVKGPLGSLNVSIPSNVKVKFENGMVTTTTKGFSKNNAFVGTVNANISNAIKGVLEGFTKELHIEGVGYKASTKGKTLVLNLGFSHPIELNIPDSIKVEIVTPTDLKITGFDKVSVGKFASEIKQFRKPEPYNGTGITYKNERIIRKVGKTAEGTKK